MSDTCYWIAVPGRMARRDCDHEFVQLYKSRGLPETDILKPYVGTTCPNCGKQIMIDEQSYKLVTFEGGE